MRFCVSAFESESTYRLQLEFLKLVIKHESGDYAGGKVGDRHTEPNAVYAPEERQDEQERDEYHHLAAQRKDDGFLRHADALEEVRRDHLEADDREEHHHDTQASCRKVYQSLVGGKGFCHAFATSSGISSPTKNPVVVTIVAAMAVIFITWFTRWYWRAP